jgi:hypothetical protein
MFAGAAWTRVKVAVGWRKRFEDRAAAHVLRLLTHHTAADGDSVAPRSSL